jgi:hypothetical protein
LDINLKASFLVCLIFGWVNEKQKIQSTNTKKLENNKSKLLQTSFFFFKKWKKKILNFFFSLSLKKKI